MAKRSAHKKTARDARTVLTRYSQKFSVKGGEWQTNYYNGILAFLRSPAFEVAIEKLQMWYDLEVPNIAEAFSSAIAGARSRQRKRARQLEVKARTPAEVLVVPTPVPA